MAATAPLGMPSGKNEHHPGWKPLQGSASDRIPGWAPSPCRLPGPVPGYETCLRRVFTAATVSSTPSRAPENVVRVNPFLARCVRGNPVCGAVQCAGKMCGAVLTARAARRSSTAARSSSNSSWPALRDCATRESVPDQTCRTSRGRSRGRDCPRSIGRRQSGSSAASWHWYEINSMVAERTGYI